MTTTSEEELFRALPGWQRHGNASRRPSPSTTSVLRRGSSATTATRSAGPAPGVPAGCWPASARVQLARPGPERGRATQLARVKVTQQRPGWRSSTARTVGGSPSTWSVRAWSMAWLAPQTS